MNNSLLQKIAQFAWPACLLAFMIPYCRILLNGSGYNQYLFRLYSGQLALAVALSLAIIQFTWFFTRKTWLAWPGIVAGIYLFVLSIKLASIVFSGLQNAGQESLALVIKAENQPMPGLYLLGIGSLALLLSSAGLGVAKRKARVLR